MAKVRDAPLARAAAGAVQQVWSQAIDCPATYDLGAATGSCVRNQGTGYYYGTTFDYDYRILTNRVVVAGGGSALDLTFDLRVESRGDTYSIDVLNGVAGIPGGSWVWDLSGSASPDGYFDARLHTARGPWTVRNGALEFVDARTPYMSISIRAGLDSGVGEIQLGGSTFASIAVNNGCITVDFIDPTREDDQTCRW
jgi:hypothetical protein